jgi:hypothetical protein
MMPSSFVLPEQRPYESNTGIDSHCRARTGYYVVGGDYECTAHVHAQAERGAEVDEILGRM